MMRGLIYSLQIPFLALCLAGPAHSDSLDKKILFEVCSYCIQTKDLRLPLKSGESRPLTWTSFVKESAVNVRSNGTWAGRANSSVTIMGGVIVSSVGIVGSTRTSDSPYVLEPDFDLSPLVIDTDASAEVAIPQIRTRNDDRYSKVLQTASVCIGSQFKVPVHYFVAPDNQPMAPVPYASTRPTFNLGIGPANPPTPLKRVVTVSQFAKDFPPDGPTICEGDLVPASALFRDVVNQQVADALVDFRNRSSDSAIAKLVQETTIRQINERFDEIAALAANLVAERVEKRAPQSKGKSKPGATK